MKEEITVGEYKSVGPMFNRYGHEPLIFIQKYDEDDDTNIEESLWVCLDCGYTDTNIRTFAHKECDCERNRVNKTFREEIEENGL